MAMPEDKVVTNPEVPPVVETANPLLYLSVILVSKQLNKALRGISLSADLLRPLELPWEMMVELKALPMLSSSLQKLPKKLSN